MKNIWVWKSINLLYPLSKSTKFGFLCFSIFLLMVSNFPSIALNTLSCLHVHVCLPSFNATEQMNNTLCRMAGLSLKRTHIGFFIKTPVCRLDGLSHAPYTDLKKTHNPCPFILQITLYDKARVLLSLLLA